MSVGNNNQLLHKDENEKDLILNHIDKLYSTLVKIWEGTTLLLTIETVLCFIIFALSISVVDVEEISAGFFKLKLTLTALLSIGAFAVMILHISIFYQFDEAEKFKKNIEEFYIKLSYDVYAGKADAFDIPSIYAGMARAFDRAEKTSGKFTRIYNYAVGVVVMIFIIGMPVLAQIAAGLKVASLHGWSWWIILLGILLITFTLVCIVIHLEAFSGNP